MYNCRGDCGGTRDILEVHVDSVLEEGVLKDIPILRSIVGVCKTMKIYLIYCLPENLRHFYLSRELDIQNFE